ncbi:MAG: shikimate dehydrogenase [Sphingomonadaceae bacterium]
MIGDPIAHSKSPAIHGFWLEKLGSEADYRACHVRPDELQAYLSMRRDDSLWRGCNVTIPHKQAIIPLLDVIEEKARGVGAVNTVVRQADGVLLGTNTDVDGVAEAIAGFDPEKRAVVLGSGGAARAAYACLAAAGCNNATIMARSADKALQAALETGLNARIVAFEEGTGVFDGAWLVINATQLGMTGQTAMPSFVLDELAAMGESGLVFDMVYAPLDTALLKAARTAGLRTSDGLEMLIGQAAHAFARFFDAMPPRECDTELREVLLA